MTPGERETVLDFFARSSGPFVDAYETHKYTIYRRRSDGSIKQVLVKVLDGGPADSSRWTVTAVDEDGRECAGNPSALLMAGGAGVCAVGGLGRDRLTVRGPW